ncbi:uncharacterized protein LOC118735870 [Rhagoletis pomonella]|uniref:uncharacterized protein LOC118735870 n=1 Tax=Rhagoletis pomonella TaxID=28610 RepID=UPI00177F67E8|nr:uncharacterized protein LOC118735870 [Rhagoletis pomonella]
MALAYDMCSSRCCNICLLLEVEKQSKGASPSKEPMPQKLHKCSGCQLVMYCSQEHQRMDWQLHRGFCRAISQIMSNYQIKHPYLISGQPHDSYTMERAILQVKYLLRTLLGRKLEYHEEELTSFPAYCEICYHLERVQSCTRCHGVSYCSPQHAAQDSERHKARCGLLQLYYCPYKVQPQMSPDMLVEDLRTPVDDVLTMDLKQAFEHITSRKLPKVPTASMKNYQLFSCAGDFSCIGTICFTLRFTEMAEFKGNKFAIFILGATVEQDLWFRQIHTKWFFLQFKQITRLELYFIGPEVLGAARREITYNYMGADRTVLYTSYRMLFQEFTKETRLKPSLIAIFNCGFSEHAPSTVAEQKEQRERTGIPGDACATKDTWSHGILEMLQTYDLPILFTSLTRLEADFDYGAILRVAQADRLETRIKRLFDVKKNPYRDLRPLRNWQNQNDDDIFYRNGYVQAVISQIAK